MRPTTLIGIGGLVVVGIILADFVSHPAGTTAAGNAIVNIEKPTISGLLGVAPR